MMRSIRLRTVYAAALCLLVVSVLVSSVSAAPYGSGGYNACVYQTGCPVVEQPPETPPSLPGNPSPDTNPAPNTVVSDVDGDSNDEQAIDADGNPDNGYEQYYDPDGSSTALVSVGAESNHGTSFILDTDGDGKPDIYWSPGKEYSAPVVVRSDVEGVYWDYTDAQGSPKRYVAEARTPTTPTTTTTMPESVNRLTPNGFGGELYEKIGELVKKVPAPVAYGFPYLLLLLILILTLRLIMQARREFNRLGVLKRTTEQEKELLLEKQNFLMLASHYFRTPMTVLKGNIELAQSLKSISDTAVASLNKLAADLQTEVESLLKDVSQNQALNQITGGQTNQISFKKAILSPFVLGPLVGIVVLVLLGNFLFLDFRVTEPRFLDFLVQGLLVVIIGQWFISSYRKRYINKQNSLDQQRVFEQQRSLDAARTTFMTNATVGLSAKIAELDNQIAALTAAGHDISRINKGAEQLVELLSRFRLALSLQSAALEQNVQRVNGAALVQSVTEQYAQKAQDKKVILKPAAEQSDFTQNQQLLHAVLGSLVDNAVTFSPEGGEVTVNHAVDNTGVHFGVEDHGKGLTPQQLDVLFQPFSKAESAETFNTEGLGFSLYLDRLIMHYLGGDITINSTPNQSTLAYVSLPKA